MSSGKDTATTGRPSDQPNILIIVTDDQGYADLSAYDHSADGIETPGMDRIAEDGVLFTQGYVTAPVCSPSRAGWNLPANISLNLARLTEWS